MTDAIATKRAFPDELDVSGMSVVSALFEDSVRAMILRGAEWVAEHPDANPTFGRIHGADPVVMTSTNAAASLLRVEMLKVSLKGTTREMIRIAINNVRAVRILGWTRYIEDLQEGRCF